MVSHRRRGYVTTDNFMRALYDLLTMMKEEADAQGTLQ